MIELAPGEPRLGLTGHAELIRETVGELPCRLPVRGVRRLIHPDLLETARMAAGVRLDLATDATAIEWDVAVSCVPGDVRPTAPFDVVVDAERVGRRHVTGRDVLTIRGLPPGPKRVQIWLPQLGFTELGPVRFSAGAQVDAAAQKPRWIAYGSSITHCTGVDGPTETWPALVAAARGWDLRCLGFAGQCQLDPVVARFIRDSPADLISVCLGANIYRRATYSARSLAGAVTGFLQTIRDGHPEVPLVVQTPVFYPAGECEPNAVGLTVSDVRELVTEAVDALRDSGDGNGDGDIHLIDGLAVLGPGDRFLLADGVHPNPAGYRLMATRLEPLLASRLPQPVAPLAG